jgi:drug/metabolite transporter (DMT)-like permease
LDNTLLSVLLGLGSAFNFGLSDFLGGLSSRKVKTVSVLVTSQVIGVITFAGLALLTQDILPTREEAFLSIVAGCLSILVGNLFYYALSVGKMSIVAPVAAVVTTSFPVVYGIIREGAPDALTLVGFALALVAVWLVSSSERLGKIEWNALVLPVAAGVLAGVMFILISTVTEKATYTPLLILRTTSFIGNILIATRMGVPRIVPRSMFPLVLGTGLTSAFATITFVLAAQVGRLDVASVLSALSPAITVILAALVVKERVNRFQIAGIALGTFAIILISV